MRCIVPNCKSKYEFGQNKSFFRLPAKVWKREKWMQILGLHNVDLESDNRICSDHFKAEHIDKTYNRIIRGALPDLPDFIADTKNVTQNSKDDNLIICDVREQMIDNIDENQAIENSNSDHVIVSHGTESIPSNDDINDVNQNINNNDLDLLDGSEQMDDRFTKTMTLERALLSSDSDTPDTPKKNRLKVKLRKLKSNIVLKDKTIKNYARQVNINKKKIKKLRQLLDELKQQNDRF